MGEGWIKDTNARFFTFPVELLRGAFTNIAGVCSDAFAYAVYVRCKTYGETPLRGVLYFRIAYDATEAKGVYVRGRELYDSFTRPVLVSVNKAIVFNFMGNPKTDFEIAVFCAFCGLRSIIGTKPYVKTNNGLLLARMFGYASVKEFEALKEKHSYYLDNFSTAQKIRYQLTKKIIRNELVLTWGLKYYSSQSKGFYASFKLGLDALVLYAKKSRKSTKLKQQQQEEKQIVERIERQLRGK
ncbi:MAG: hypothetical protein LCH91_05135 [Bacteroidetes bacterium]|nr:hypothetical protein [Bacteroidota bacterium]